MKGTAKLSDFAERFWHFDLITSMSLEQFTDEYLNWAKEIPPKQIQGGGSLGISFKWYSHTVFQSPSTKMLVQEAVSVLRTVDSSLPLILARMKELAKSLPEYPTVREMGGVGDVLVVKLIAKNGAVKKPYNAKVLIVWTGIDPPPYESGQFIGSKRKITKRSSSTLRKVGYEVMRVLKSHPEPKDDAVYN